MTAPTIHATAERAEQALLAQLGLPPSTDPETVDEVHLAISQYLAAAPATIRGWAHAQAAALDEAYLSLTDPVGLGGSALRSPTTPPAVEPGGPATPPARRATTSSTLVPAADEVDAEVAEVAEPADDAGAAEDDTDLDDLDALYASVTPSAHADMLATPASRAKAKARAQAATAPSPAGTSPWKRVAIGLASVMTVVAIGAAAFVLGGGGTGDPAASPAASVAAPPAIDEAKVAGLMTKLQTTPDDITTLMALADEFYAGGQFETAGSWLDKVLAIEPGNVQALLAKGAVAFNTADLAAAETTWKQVVTIDPKNVEAHYDLGFLYLNQATPDWAGLQREWNEVVRLDPTSDLAATVKSHLESLAAASMLPGASAGASSAPSSAPSPAPSSAASPAASAQP